MYASNIGSIGTVRKFSPVRRASSAASPLEWSEEYFDGIETPYTFSRADRVARDRRDQRRVDAAGEPDQHGAEAVLRDVRAQADDQRRVHLLVVVQPLGVPAGRAPARTPAAGSSERIDAVDPQAVVARRPSAASAAAAGRSRSRTTQPSANCGARAITSPSRVDDDRVAVEDQLVLAADHRQVREGAAGLLGALADQFQPDVVLVALVRRGVDREQQPGPGGAGGRHPAAVLPQVLADRQRHVDAVHAGSPACVSPGTK